MNNIEKLPRKKIKEWIKKFKTAISNESDEHNIKLYKKWLEEAKLELDRRDELIRQYMRCKEKSMFN